MQWLHLLFRDDALVFYLNTIEYRFAYLGTAMATIEKHFNSISSQNQFYRYLRNLHIEDRVGSTPLLSFSLD